MISSIEPRNGGSRVALKNGEKLDLEGAGDVDDGNDGVAVVDGDNGVVFVAWERVARVDFD